MFRMDARVQKARVMDYDMADDEVILEASSLD